MAKPGKRFCSSWSFTTAEPPWYQAASQHCWSSRSFSCRFCHYISERCMKASLMTWPLGGWLLVASWAAWCSCFGEIPSPSRSFWIGSAFIRRTRRRNLRGSRPLVPFSSARNPCWFCGIQLTQAGASQHGAAPVPLAVSHRFTTKTAVASRFCSHETPTMVSIWWSLWFGLFRSVSPIVGSMCLFPCSRGNAGVKCPPKAITTQHRWVFQIATVIPTTQS